MRARRLQGAQSGVWQLWLAGLAALALGGCSRPQQPDAQPQARPEAPAEPVMKGPVRYVLASELELRKELSTSSEVLARLPSGTPCEQLEEPEQFDLALHVRCQGKAGYVPRKGVGPNKPSVEEALAAAEQPDLSTFERLEHVLRGVALAPENATVLAALKKHYLAHQFSRLSKREDAEELDWRPVECADASKPDTCLTEAVLPSPLFDARTLERRGQDFLAIGARRDFLYVVLGTSKAPSSGGAGLEYAIHDIAFESLEVPLVRRVLGLPASEHASKPFWSVSGGKPNAFSRQTRAPRLEAVEGEQRHVVIDMEKGVPPGRQGKRDDLLPFEALELLLVDDFDQDGRDDALVEASTVGNCCVPCYLFTSVTGSGKPVVTNSFCSGEGPPVVGVAEGRTTFTLPDEEGKKTFVLKGSKARLYEEQVAPTLEVVRELTAEQLWKLAEERETSPGDTMETLAYDLNEDGQDERIECKGWERWSALMCKVYLGDRQIGEVGGCKSLGELPSMTAGMHDLACDRRKTFRWNGSSYP